MAGRGAVAEWLGRGLQSLVHQFDSGRRLSDIRNLCVGLVNAFRFDHWLGRFNDRFGATAVATQAEFSMGGTHAPTTDPTAVVAIVGEIERKATPAERADP